MLVNQDTAFKLINDLAQSVADLMNDGSAHGLKKNHVRINRASAKLFMVLTGKPMSTDLQNKVLTTEENEN